MKRIYVTPMVELSRPGYFDPKLAVMYAGRPFTDTNVLPPPDSTGHALVALETPDHRDAVADTTNMVLPDISLDTQLGTHWNNTAKTYLTNAGFDIGKINNQTTLREALNILGRQHNSNFDANNFDVRVPSQ